MTVVKAYLENQRQFWNVDPITSRFGRVDTVSASESEYATLANEHFSKICAGIHFSPELSILEIGCGVGRLLSKMQSQPHRLLIGVDISSNMIDLCRQRVPEDSRTKLFVSSGADLSMIPTQSVDFCYSNDVFIHIADIDVIRSYFNEIVRVLKPGALFRFNVRELNINRMFSNSPGGILAKISHLLQNRHLHRYLPGTEGFSGIMFRPRDLHSIARDRELKVWTISKAPDPSGGGFLWCDYEKPR